MLIKDTRQRLPWSLGGFTERQVERRVGKCRETWEGEHWEKGALEVSPFTPFHYYCGAGL